MLPFPPFQRHEPHLIYMSTPRESPRICGLPEGAVAAAAGQHAARVRLGHHAEYEAGLPPLWYVIPCKSSISL